MDLTVQGNEHHLSQSFNIAKFINQSKILVKKPLSNELTTSIYGRHFQLVYIPALPSFFKPCKLAGNKCSIVKLVILRDFANEVRLRALSILISLLLYSEILILLSTTLTQKLNMQPEGE